MRAPAPGPMSARDLAALIGRLKASADWKDACNTRLVAWYESMAGEIAK